VRILSIAVFSLALSACGFQLRGTATLPFESLYVEGDPALVAELTRAIRTGTATRVAASPAEAQAVVQLQGAAREKRILSLSGAGRVREYQLIYRLGFRFLDREKRELIPDQQIELRRDLFYSDTQVLAKESEEELLFRDMQSDAVQQIMRRLSAVRLAANGAENRKSPPR
jgi:LPS-assembly lipoprotein